MGKCSVVVVWMHNKPHFTVRMAGMGMVSLFFSSCLVSALTFYHRLSSNKKIPDKMLEIAKSTLFSNSC